MILPQRLIKFGFHLLYYQLAWMYDLIAWSVSFGQWADWRRLALPFLRPGPTLELAYGTGAFLVDMYQAGYTPVGIDLSPYMARLTARRLHRHLLPLRLNQARAQALPFPSAHFINVVATFPTDYIMQPDTLAEIQRVLTDSPEKPGQLVIVFEGHLRGPWPLRPFIEWLYHITDQRSLPPAKPLHQFAAHGFTARWQTVEQNGALAHLLIAQKQTPPHFS
jgi:ubiquinone/menaquinone biosynthesis C-methylase UbiE